MKKLTLDIDERLEILQAIPARGGDKETQRAYKSFKKKIHPNDEEEEFYQIRPNKQNGKFSALKNRDTKKEFECEETELEALKALLDLMESNNIFPEWGVDVDDQLIELLPKKKAKK